MALPLGLPRFALFYMKTYSKYLCQTNEYVAGSLRCTGDEVTSPAIKFEMEMAKTGGSLFNIRSCHNNKYWRAESPDSLFITAAADKPNEDSSQWSCTLFEAVPVEPDAGSNNIRLHFVRNQKPVTVVYGSPDHIHALYPEYSDVDYASKITVIDAESLVILPKTVVFKASNGKYLQPYPGRMTANATDIGGQYIAFLTTYINLHGYVRLTLKENDLVLCYVTEDDAVMTPDGPPPSLDDKVAMFKPIKVAGPKFEDGKVVASTTIAIRSAANNLFLRYDNARGDNVYADALSIIDEAVLAVDEPVMSRSIYDVKFRLADSRIYDETIVTLATIQVANSSNVLQVEDLKLKYVKKSSSTFDRSVSVSAGVKTSFKTGVPFIAAEGQIDISPEAERSVGWSDTTEETQEAESSQVVEVPPMTIVTVSVVATNGKCDVPFSYTQHDMLFDGTEVITEMDDGIYRGVNSWNFRRETTSKPLPL